MAKVYQRKNILRRFTNVDFFWIFWLTMGFFPSSCQPPHQLLPYSGFYPVSSLICLQ